MTTRHEAAAHEIDLGGIGDDELGRAHLGRGVVTASASNIQVLSLILLLLDDFERAGISHCYWKSTGRIRAALAGQTDLDLLIAQTDQHRAERLLLERGYKRFPSVAARDHPALESFIGYDEASGRLVHVHLHFRLISGQALLRDYRLPWESILLARSVWHPPFAIRVLDPASAALLVIVRSALELQWTDPVALRHWRDVTRKFARERDLLAAQIDRETLRARANETFAGDLPEKIVDGFFSRRPLQRQSRLRRRLRKELAANRAYNVIEARLRGWVRAALWIAGGANKWLLHAPRPSNRRAPGGGLVVAVVGVDGSGKSSVTAAIRHWLGAEVDVMPIYFGTGDGRPSLFLLPFKMLVPLATRLLRVKRQGTSHGRISSRARGPAYGLMMMVWATVVAVEKRSKLRAANRGAGRGLVVIADRYPQDEDIEYNEAPLLSRVKRAPFWLRRFEQRSYALARHLPPDLVFKLHVTAETIAQREPDMDPLVVRQRIVALRGLAFPGARVVPVDAERPLAEVIDCVKREIWSLL